MSIRLIQRLFSAQITATGSGAVSDAALLQDIVAELVVTEDVAGTSLDVKIEDSADGGVTWHDWITFTQLGTTGKEIKVPARPPLGDIRVTATVVGGTWTVAVRLSANPLT